MSINPKTDRDTAWRVIKRLAEITETATDDEFDEAIQKIEDGKILELLDKPTNNQTQPNTG